MIVNSILRKYFINDLSSVTVCPKKIFTDDTKAHKSIQGIDDKMLLQNAIYAMVDWSLRWQLDFNGQKCVMLHLGKKNEEHRFAIMHDNQRIDLKVTTCEKDLGVQIEINTMVSDKI